MDDLLTPVKTVRNVKSNIEKFETLSLRESQARSEVTSTTKKTLEGSEGEDSPLKSLEKPEQRAESLDKANHATKDVTKGEHVRSSKSGERLQQINCPTSSPGQALAILKEQPAADQFEAVIRYLEDGIRKKHGFNLHVPSAPAAQILNVLVTSVIPDRWAILNADAASKSDIAIRKSLLLCMNSTAGIGAVIARIQSMLTSPQIRQPGSSQHVVLKDTVSFFACLVYHKTFVRDLLYRTQSLGGKPGQKQAIWAEATSLFAGSKILNVFQEASAISEPKSEVPAWLQDPRDYSGWLGVNIASAAISIAPSVEEAWKMLANFLKRALSLGHRGRFCLPGKLIGAR